jgi:hypothetical protein
MAAVEFPQYNDPAEETGKSAIPGVFPGMLLAAAGQARDGGQCRSGARSSWDRQGLGTIKRTQSNEALIAIRKGVHCTPFSIWLE